MHPLSFSSRRNRTVSEVFGRNITSWQVFGTGKWHRTRWNGLCSAGSRGVRTSDLEPAVLGKMENGNHWKITGEMCERQTQSYDIDM